MFILSKSNLCLGQVGRDYLVDLRFICSNQFQFGNGGLLLWRDFSERQIVLNKENHLK